MFDFLKKKLKEAVSVFSKKVEEQAKVETKEEIKEIKEEIKLEKEKKEEVKEKPKEETKEKGFFEKIKEKLVTKKIDEKQFEKLFSDLEIVLLENNVALEVIDKIKEDLKLDLVDVPLKGKIEDLIKESLKNSLEEVLRESNFDLLNEIKNKKDKPYVIAFFGVNGAGKTTTIAKIAKLCQENKFSVVLGAGDCFRKGSIEQLEEWGRRLKVKVIKHQYDADMTAVCFDTVKFAKSHNIDVVLLDTAGRQHTNKNLMEELSKLNRVIKPDLKIFIAESIIGNDAVDQGRIFDEKIGVDGVILTKADVDEKGGAVISISYVTQKPILYVGVGQGLSDLKEFSKDTIMKSLGF